MTRKHDNKPKRSSNRSAKPPKGRGMRQDEGLPAGCALCPVFGRCGGCSQLDTPYDRQLARKQRMVYDLLADSAPASAQLPILGMDEPFHYRNKVISPYAPAKGKRPRGGFKGDRGGSFGAPGGKNSAGRSESDSKRPASRTKLARADILTGMYAPGTHRLIPTDACAIENETAKQITLAIRDIMARWDMAPYNEDTGEGFVRHAVVRVGHESGEVLVTVVTNGDEFPSAKAFCRELVKRVPAVTTIVQNVNTRQTNVILGEKERTLYGPGFILDTLCGLSFRISSQSFYQVNATQTEVLYDEAIRLANLTGTETVIDAYCGTGTIGLVAARRGAARVIGVDNVEAAIRDARGNARHNGIENAEFVAEDATRFMEKLASSRAVGAGEAPGGAVRSVRESKSGDAMDATGKGEPSGGNDDVACAADRASSQDGPLVLLMDPPRAGSTPAFLKAAAALAPERIVYISCNPKTQARDVRQLVGAGYVVRAVRPVDMFPHTDHVESIVMLERGSAVSSTTEEPRGAAGRPDRAGSAATGAAPRAVLPSEDCLDESTHLRPPTDREPQEEYPTPPTSGDSQQKDQS